MTAGKKTEKAASRALLWGVRLSASLIAGGLAAGSAAAVSWGLFLLLLTPILRVTMLAAGFARERDWAMAGASALVLALIALSVALRIHH